MNSQVQHGYIVLADISGFTSFMEETEITHSSSILSNLIDLIIGQFTPTMNLAEVEGDAVFAYADQSQISRGELLLEIIEATYAAFRDNQKTMQHNVTCPCKACQTISSLDLKFITHYGEYVLQNVAGKNKPVGSDVNVVHRLLKNNVSESTGWTGYALFSEKSLKQMRISPAEMHVTRESYEHLGKVNANSINLNDRYRELVNERQVFLTTQKADVSVSYDFEAPPALVWDWLNDPVKRTSWQIGSAWELKKRPNGRTGPAAQSHSKMASQRQFRCDGKIDGGSKKFDHKLLTNNQSLTTPEFCGILWEIIMIKVMVTYKVKPNRVQENEELVKAVYDELRQNNDPDIHYATFKLDDGQTFAHIASFATPEKQAQLTESKSFSAFRENLPDRCEVPPNPMPLA